MRLIHGRPAIAGLCAFAIVTTLLAGPAGATSAQATQTNSPAPCPNLTPGTTTSNSSTTSTESTETTETTESPTGPTETSSQGPTETSSQGPTETSSPSAAVPTESADRCGTLEALQQAMPSVLAGSLNPPTVTPDQGAVLTTKGDDTQVDVPNNPAADVTLNGSGAPPVAVGLPTAASGKPATAANKGVAVYRKAAAQTSVAVQPVGQGAVRIMQVITGPNAPTTYRFPLQVPPGGSIRRVPGEQERYVILDANGDGVASISAPWSKDRNHQTVETHYRLEGRTLIQEVDHAGHSYPVVADPLLSLGCGWFYCSVYLSHSATRVFGGILSVVSGKTGDKIRRAAEAACALLSSGTAAVVCTVAGEIIGQGLIDTLVDAVNQGGCLRLRFGPPLLIKAAMVSHSSSCSDGALYTKVRRPGLAAGERIVNAHNATYVLIGGAKLWIPNRDEFNAQGYDWTEVKLVSSQELHQFGDVPIDGTLIKERDDPHTFVISGRHRWWVQNRDQFERNHFSWKDVHIVANGSLVSCPYAGPLPSL